MKNKESLNNPWFTYITCKACGHIERHFTIIPYVKCEKCGGDNE